MLALELSNDNLMKMLQHARDVDIKYNQFTTDKQKEYFDRHASHHTFHEGQ